MQKALYHLEDRLTYSAALTRMSFVRRRIGRLSHMAGRAGDAVGELRDGTHWFLVRIRSVRSVHGPAKGI